jgi:hypothetical protein
VESKGFPFNSPRATILAELNRHLNAHPGLQYESLLEKKTLLTCGNAAQLVFGTRSDREAWMQEWYALRRSNPLAWYTKRGGGKSCSPPCRSLSLCDSETERRYREASCDKEVLYYRVRTALDTEDR